MIWTQHLYSTKLIIETSNSPEATFLMTKASYLELHHHECPSTKERMFKKSSI